MRARWLKPEFFRDRKIASLGPVPALVFQSLWCIADDGGTAPCDADRLKNEMFGLWPGLTVDAIDQALTALENATRIRRYRVGDDTYARIQNFGKHQRVHKPSAFRYPQVGAAVITGSASLVPEPSVTPRILDTQTPRLPDSPASEKKRAGREGDRDKQTTTPSSGDDAAIASWLAPVRAELQRAGRSPYHATELASRVRELHAAGITSEQLTRAARVMLEESGLHRAGLTMLLERWDRWHVTGLARERWSFYNAERLTEWRDGDAYRALVRDLVVRGAWPSYEMAAAELDKVRPWDIARTARDAKHALETVATRLASLATAA